MVELLLWFLVAAALIAVAFLVFRRKLGRPVSPALSRGQQLPDFTAIDEQGNAVNSAQLRGNATVILFVRGTWCPFCSSQVKTLTGHYKDIIDLGGRLILITPKPLDTTRRVAEFFEVEFDFWLDESLAVARQLGLLQPKGVPRDFHEEYGADTVWPTAIVTNADGEITYVKLSKMLADRPNPKELLAAVRDATAA